MNGHPGMEIEEWGSEMNIQEWGVRDVTGYLHNIIHGKYS